MAISTVAASAAATSTTNSANSLTKLGTDFNSFLTLLTTQLKNQSPTDPVDANQFTQQLVQFAGVQQQVNTNTYLEKLLAAVQGNQVSSAASYVGTNVQAPGDKGALVNGEGQFGYNLPANAGKAEVFITNSAGVVVFNGTGSTDQGKNFVSWDGINSFTGQKMADGVYTISVKATDTNNRTIEATPFMTGTVDSASIIDGEVQLGIGALLIPADKVSTITGLTKGSTAS